jgi:hypothetical protein
MELPFAVALMRSSYNAVDELDFTPMDEFQKSFFLYRQDEWSDYKSYHPNVLQGDLADPLYFDFISFVQYAVIGGKCKEGQYDFVEKIGANGTTQLVRRNTNYSNDELPYLHSDLVGRKLLRLVFVYILYTTEILFIHSLQFFLRKFSFTCSR